MTGEDMLTSHAQLHAWQSTRNGSRRSSTSSAQQSNIFVSEILRQWRATCLPQLRELTLQDCVVDQPLPWATVYTRLTQLALSGHAVFDGQADATLQGLAEQVILLS